MATGTDTLSLVPPRRLGQLLVEHRTSSGLSVAEIAERASILPDERSVEDLEAGLHRLTDDELTAVTSAYGVELGTLVPQRSELIVDLDSRTLSVGDHRVTFAGPRSRLSDELLTHYLALVRALRSLPADAEVVLRQRDMGALSAALVQPPDDIRSRLHELMDGQPLELRDRARRLAGRPLVPALGVLVGVTSIGALILASPKSDIRSGPPATARPPVVAQAPTADESPGLDLAAARPITVTTVSASLSPSVSPSAAPPTTITTVPPATAPAPTAPPATAPPTASPPNPTEADPGTAELREAALALIPYPWEEMLPGWTISVEPARAGYLGMTNIVERRIEVYVRPEQRVGEVAHTLAHEIGHAVDVTYNDEADRARWRESRGLAADHPWFTGDGLTDFSVGAGDFAECFAYWQVGAGEHSALGGPPTAAQLNLLAELSFP